MGDGRSIPQQRIIQKMDEYMGRRDYAGAERHLLYWLEESKYCGDRRGELMVRNEMIGHYRKTGEKEKAFESIDQALRLLEALDYRGSISAGTTYVNAATACSAFGMDGRALELFEEAREVYENSPAVQPQLLGGLYNNMGLACAALGRFREADVLYRMALAQMEKVSGGELEQAITLINMAEAAEREKGMEQADREIADLMDRALELLETPSLPRDGYYDFVREKCAPAFAHYGYIL